MTYGSFDYTSLLYLSDYLEDFGGGRFVFMEEGANKTVEPRAGRTRRLRAGSSVLHTPTCMCMPYTRACGVQGGFTWSRALFREHLP